MTRLLLLLLLASSQAPAAAPEAGIYFQRDDPRPWQNCYALPFDEALRRVREGRFKGASLISVLDVQARGRDIVIRHGDAASPRTAVLERCPFEESERAVLMQCEVTVQTLRRSPRLDSLEPYPEIEDEWRRRDPGARLIDCKAGSVRTVRNAWWQTFTLADHKLISRIAATGLPLAPLTAMGRISEGGGADPRQGWSAQVAFDFMENRLQPEICDASVEEISVPRYRQVWLSTRNGGWCPWGLEIVSLACPGLPRVDSSTSFSRLSFDPDSPEARARCGAAARP